MDPQILQHHATVSRTALDFLDHAVRQRQCLSRYELLDDDVHPMFRDYPYALHSWPWFLAPGLRERLETCVTQVPTLLLRAMLAEFEDDAEGLAEAFDLSLPAAHLFLQREPDASALLQRTDGVLTAEGFKIVELNCGAGIGGWQIHWMDGQYRKQPGLDRFMAGRACHSRHIPREFMAYLVRAMVERGLPCRLVMVTDRDFAERGGPAAVRAIFDEALQPFGRDGEIRFVEDPSGLQPRADGLYHQGSRIGAFVGAEGMADLTPMLLRAALANQLFWPDSPLDTVLGDKRALALLHQHRDSGLFSPAEQALVDEFIPWSAPVRPGTVRHEGREQSLETLLRRQPAQFVVKVAQGMQGDDVFIGKYTPPAQWDAVVSRALAEPGWLAQGFCASLPFYGQRGDSGYGVFDVIWGVFGFGNRYGGTWLRLMDKDSGDGVINSSKGAQEAIVYEVEA